MIDEGLAGLPGGLDRPVIDVGQVHDVKDVVARAFEPAAQQILEQKGPEVADMREIPDGRTAGVERDARRRERHERLDTTGEGIEEGKRRRAH